MAAAGIHTGTRVCVERSKRTLVEFGEPRLLFHGRPRTGGCASRSRAGTERSSATPGGHVYVVFTTSEEVGGIGGTYASRTLPGDLTIALEVGPTKAEYATTVSGGPIVAYSDALHARL